MKFGLFKLSCAVAALGLLSSAAGAWDTGSIYTLHSTTMDPGVAVTRSVNWSGHSGYTSQRLGVFNIEIWQQGTYSATDRSGYLGALQTLCIDLDQQINVPGTWDATFMAGSGDAGKPVASDAWNRLTYMLSANSIVVASGNSAEKAGLQLATWELLYGDSAAGADKNWNLTGNFRVSYSGSNDPAVAAASSYLASAASIGNWSGSDSGWWSSPVYQDQIIVSGEQAAYRQAAVVPEANTVAGFGAALAINGLGVAGTGYYLRRRYNRASASRFAKRQVNKLPMLIDMTVSALLVIALSPVLLAVFAAGAAKTGKPVLYS